jgi:hypothetical protein
MLAEGDLIWVHDYHLIPLGEALRGLGCSQPIGFSGRGTRSSRITASIASWSAGAASRPHGRGQCGAT